MPRTTSLRGETDTGCHLPSASHCRQWAKSTGRHRLNRQEWTSNWMRMWDYQEEEWYCSRYQKRGRDKDRFGRKQCGADQHSSGGGVGLEVEAKQRWWIVFTSAFIPSLIVLSILRFRPPSLLPTTSSHTRSHLSKSTYARILGVRSFSQQL